MKEGINAEFADANPALPRNLTLSKIMNIREELIALASCIDRCTVAAAWIYFLALVNIGIVTKRDRKLYAAACVVIAYKVYEEIGDDFEGRLQCVLRALKGLDQKEHLGVKDILRKEFDACASLNFSLIIQSEPAEFRDILSEIDRRNFE